MRIVCADDSVQILPWICGILQRAGHTIVGQGRSADEALALCERLKPDVVTLDNDMPPGNGYEVAKKIYDLKLSGGVVMITSQAQQGAFKEVLDRGGILVGKPCSPTQIVKAVEQVGASLSID